MAAARRTPLIAALPKMLFPFLVIVPGTITIASTLHGGASGFSLPHNPDGLNYDLSIPMMRMLDLGLTALLAMGFGFFSHPAIYERSLGININMKWGWVLLVFGAGMLWLAWRGSAARKH